MMADGRIRILVADDHSVVREGIRHVLERIPSCQVVGEAASGDEVLPLAERHEPDIVILDISMPGPSGLALTTQLKQRQPGVGILILTMHDNPEYVLEAVRSGADGYLLKDTAAADLPAAIRALTAGESYFSPPVASKLSAALKGELAQEQRAAALNALTAREREVLHGIATGLTNQAIADQLGISRRTVETHRESLMRKLRIRHVAGLTKFALETGVISA
jgi:DNA-binding NarL/FixJ family response regulator